MENLGGLFNPSSPEMEAMADLTYYIIGISLIILAIIVIAVTIQVATSHLTFATHSRRFDFDPFNA